MGTVADDRSTNGSGRRSVVWASCPGRAMSFISKIASLIAVKAVEETITEDFLRPIVEVAMLREWERLSTEHPEAKTRDAARVLADRLRRRMNLTRVGKAVGER
jgi:hypothetical protein